MLMTAHALAVFNSGTIDAVDRQLPLAHVIDSISDQSHWHTPAVLTPVIRQNPEKDLHLEAYKQVRISKCSTYRY